MPYKIENAIIALLMMIGVSVKGQEFKGADLPIFNPKWTVDTTMGVLHYLQKHPEGQFDVVYAPAIAIDSSNEYRGKYKMINPIRHIYLYGGKEFDRTKWYQFIPADQIVNK